MASQGCLIYFLSLFGNLRLRFFINNRLWSDQIRLIVILTDLQLCLIVIFLVDLSHYLVFSHPLLDFLNFLIRQFLLPFFVAASLSKPATLRWPILFRQQLVDLVAELVLAWSFVVLVLGQVEVNAMTNTL